jgi:hypothetical protein
MEKWRRQGNRFDTMLIQGDRPTPNHTLVRQHGFCHDKSLYAFHFSDRINTGEGYSNGSVRWQTQHADLLFVEDLVNLLSAMPHRTHGLNMGLDAPQ